jgi:hypothetical protein
MNLPHVVAGFVVVELVFVVERDLGDMLDELGRDRVLDDVRIALGLHGACFGKSAPLLSQL